MKEVLPQHLVPQSIKTTQPIPKDIPADLLAQHQMYIEDIGEPTLATFLTSSFSDPTNWYLFRALLYCIFSLPSILILSFLLSLILGGCLRNMMV